MLYYNYLVNNVAFIANQNVLQKITVTVGSNNYNITTTNYYSFQTAFGSTSQTLANLQGLNCAIDSYNGGPNYSNIAYNNSGTWVSFCICGIISLCIIINI